MYGCHWNLLTCLHCVILSAPSRPKACLFVMKCVERQTKQLFSCLNM
uniref:Uncharacterized protein n=1 Tax=Anguilla anguilla TaxID=7936 RepID=A0A0E9WCI7_ANGAN